MKEILKKTDELVELIKNSPAYKSYKQARESLSPQLQEQLREFKELNLRFQLARANGETLQDAFDIEKRLDYLQGQISFDQWGHRFINSETEILELLGDVLERIETVCDIDTGLS